MFRPIAERGPSGVARILGLIRTSQRRKARNGRYSRQTSVSGLMRLDKT